MSFSTEQIYLLNTLTYISKKDVYDAADCKTVEEFVEGILNSDHVLNSIVQEEAFMSAEQVKSVCKQIQVDPQLKNMEIAYADRTQGGADRIIFKTENAQGEMQAIVAFEGTMGGNEWRDNFLAGTMTDQRDGVSSAEQTKTLNWFTSDPDVNAILDTCDRITVSGHSKGGNKAKYLTLFDDRIDECVSFDGQGFSDDFVRKYENVIRVNQGKIQNYNHQADFVNNLLNDIGAVHFIKGMDCGADYFRNHSLFSLGDGMPFDKHETDQWPPMTEMDRILNGYLRSLKQKERKKFLELAAELAADLMGHDESFSLDDLVDYGIRLGFGGKDLLKEFLIYALTYGSLEFGELLVEWAKKNMPWQAWWMEQMLGGTKAMTGVTDGEDIRYASLIQCAPVLMGDTCGEIGQMLAVDTDMLLKLSEKANDLCMELSGCAAAAESCAALCREYSIRIRIPLDMKLRLVSERMSLSSGMPEEVLHGISKEIKALTDAVNRLSVNMSKVAARFEENEKRVSSRFARSTGSPSKYTS